MANLGDWEQFWADEPVLFTDEPVGELRPSFGRLERGIAENWYDDFDFYGGVAINLAPVDRYIDQTFTRRTGRKE